jgi:coenzyme F420-reducing hydrogenase gamma subunit|tara:strand:+ start:156 stop:422 length:267 start_codon:yes stop_codon:yes gene_type:complete
MPFTKGDPNINTSGRPPKPLAIAHMLRSIAEEEDVELKATNLELICRTAIEQAIEGNPHARNWVADRMEGKAREYIEQKIIKDELIIE